MTCALLLVLQRGWALNSYHCANRGGFKCLLPLKAFMTLRLSGPAACEELYVCAVHQGWH